MRKILAGLLVAGLILVGTVGFCEEEKTAKPSLKMVSQDIRTAVRENPVSITDYLDTSIDFITEVTNRLLKTGKPVYLLKGQMGLQITIYEQDNYNIVAGLTPNEKFVGVEVTSLPLGGDVAKIFEKLHPELLYVFDDNNWIGLGVCYKFRTEQ